MPIGAGFLPADVRRSAKTKRSFILLSVILEFLLPCPRPGRCWPVKSGVEPLHSKTLPRPDPGDLFENASIRKVVIHRDLNHVARFRYDSVFPMRLCPCAGRTGFAGAPENQRRIDHPDGKNKFADRIWHLSGRRKNAVVRKNDPVGRSQLDLDSWGVAIDVAKFELGHDLDFLAGEVLGHSP